MKEPKTTNTTLAINKKAKHEYEILDRFEAGLVLTGAEVKAIRGAKASLAGAFVREKNGELYVLGLNILEDLQRDIKLLMHKREITKLSSKIAEKGLTIIPLSIYTKRRCIKVELALAKGKKLHDKREALKKKAHNRELRRA